MSNTHDHYRRCALQPTSYCKCDQHAILRAPTSNLLHCLPVYRRLDETCRRCEGQAMRETNYHLCEVKINTTTHVPNWQTQHTRPPTSSDRNLDLQRVSQVTRPDPSKLTTLVPRCNEFPQLPVLLLLSLDMRVRQVDLSVLSEMTCPSLHRGV